MECLQETFIGAQFAIFFFYICGTFIATYTQNFFLMHQVLFLDSEKYEYLALRRNSTYVTSEQTTIMSKMRNSGANEACKALSQFKQTSRLVISCTIISVIPWRRKKYIALHPDNISRCYRNEQACLNASLNTWAANLTCMNSRRFKQTAITDRFAKIWVRCTYM